MSTKYEDKLTLDRHAMKDRATSHLRIYVGGIGEQASVDDLYEHFIQYGQIDGIVVNRNFGFVQFKEESSAQDAINKANGTLIQGKSVSVRTSQTNPIRREAEVAAVHPDKPQASAGVDKPMPRQDEASEELYDSYGNYVGDQAGYREDEFEEVGYTRPEGRLASRGRGAARGEARGAARGEGRGAGRGEPRGAGRGRGRARGSFRERSPNGGRVPGGEWPERSYDRFSQPEYGRTLPVSERNDCEIIVVAKSLTEYAEYIEGRLKRLGIVVDLLFPMEDVPIGKVLGNIASRGCLYAILVMPQNQEQRSLTLTILHGLPQEHRNMPLEDALQLVSRNFQEVQRGGPSGREAVYALLGQLADGRALTVLQYDKVIDYLKERREQQVKIELGEPHTVDPATIKTQVELQQRILNILNDKTAPSEPVAPVVPKTQGSHKLFNDPTVRKALDSILQKFT